MFELFECVAVAVKEKGARGLCDMVPGGGYAFDIAGHAYRLYCERRKAAKLREELEKVAAASAAEAKKVAEEVARKVLSEAKEEDLPWALELYLTQIPNALRQSLKRPEDPSGKTVPPDFALDSPEAFAKLLPLRVPHFRPGADLPGRPGWRLEELLGAGGFGEVWLARHSFIPHRRAVKFCTDEKVRAKLTSHEGRVIARVMEQGAHPNVVPLLDAVLDGEAPWLMYEYVGGGSLTDLILRWQGLPEGDRQSLAVVSLSQLAAAVGTFHRLAPPIVHRDLKPANILLTNGGSEITLRITDFGIGGVAVDYIRTRPGGLSMMTGWLETSLRGSYTPLYASPQQSRGAAPDPRDDVHALGVIAFQMLTGKLAEAPSPRFERDLRRRGVSDEFIELIGDCVDSEPGARPKDAAEMAERLNKLKGGAKAATAPKPAEMKPTPVESKPLPASPPASLGGSPIPFPQGQLGAYRATSAEYRARNGHPANGRDVVYVRRETENGGRNYHPLFDLSPDVRARLLAGGYTPETSRLFIHRDKSGGEVAYEELDTSARSLIDPKTGTAPVTAPRRKVNPDPAKVENKPAPPPRTPLEGGSPPTAFLPFATPMEPEKWLIPLRGIWFTRSTEKPDSPWAPSNVRLPGDIIAKPGEAYRLAFNPDTTGDDELAKLKALAGLPGLEAIDLSGCARVTDAGLMHLAHLRGLKAVGLADTQVTDSGVTLLLTRFPELEAIGLAGTTNVSQTVVPYLARMRKLKMLTLPPRADTIDVRLEFAKRRPSCQLV